jgi:hypothetical protein
VSYREENGQVIITMSPQDFDTLSMALGALMILRMENRAEVQRLFELVNRVHDGKPGFTPYQVGEKS